MSEETLLPTVSQAVPSEPTETAAVPRPSHIVGIGASAGGLEALERLFEHMPLNTGMAFVVVQHLSPDFRSLMDELLARKTRIPVHRVEEGMEVRPNAIYLIPPKKDMIIANGRLLLTDKDPRQGITLPIDHFFRSLAHECGDRAVAIILSGTGSDGSRGLLDVYDAGGLVVVQAPETAKFDGMPNSATRTGAVDLVLPPEEIPAALLRSVGDPLWRQKEAAKANEHAEPGTGMDAVFRMLRDQFGIDFSHYKVSTVNRRVERRLLLNHIIDLDEYVRRLRDDESERSALYKDLLIGVTRFFRDAEAFERLAEQVLPRLLDELGPDEDFRAWVAGCATGEEAYSLAILLQECLDGRRRKPSVKIFATDVHKASLDFASAGVYDEAQLADVSPARRDRFFARKGEGFQVTPELRQMVVFAPHNLLKDAPFTKLDLISCRNLMIYFQPPVQRKVLSLFHFALKTGGALFLGPSEGPGELSDEFTVVDPHWRLYRKLRDVRLPPDLRLPLSAAVSYRRPAEGPLPRSTAPAGPPDQHLLSTYDQLLDAFMPPALLINDRRELVQVFSDANRYLQVRRGRVSTDLLDLVDPDLRIILSGALPRVLLDRVAVTYRGVRVRRQSVGPGAPGAITPPDPWASPNPWDGEGLVNLTVKPFVNARSSAVYALILFEDQGPAPAPEATEVDVGQASREHFGALEAELRYTKENLQASIEELETSNEELQATNEELVASNEELQSTNEELHSVNEELYTVNAEYQKKIAELTELTADMDNLLESTEVHTLFLDGDLRIRKFTPKIADTFNLLPQDVGRRIDSFTYTLDFPGLTERIRAVMEAGRPFEQQVQDRRGDWFLLRIFPYSSKQAVKGVVLTLIDLARVKRAEAEARSKDRQLSSILKNSPHLVYIKDRAGRFLVADEAFHRLIGGDPAGKTAQELFPPALAEQMSALDNRVLDEGATVETEKVLPGPDGPRTYLVVKFPLTDQDGKVIGLGGVGTDVTRIKAAERQAREAVEQRDRFLAMLSHELRNPLGAIANAALILNHRDVEESMHREAAAVVQRQAEQMTRLLDDLLDVSRITQDKIVLHRQPVRLDDVADEATRVVRPALEKAGLTIEVCRSGDPPVVDGDPTRLQQLVVNLLMNAIKYTPPGGQVTLALERDAGRAVLRVKDTGVGIRPEMLPQVFDLFVQADDTLDRSAGGLGVGLTLVRAIAQLHGGTVQAESDGPGRGSQFTVRLPLCEAAPAEAASAPAAAWGPEPAVVLIEDNDDSRRMFESLLRLDGYRVVAAQDGQEGLQAILGQRPTLALVDIGLPGMSGYEVARQVRSRLGRDGVYLVALTGYGRPTDRQAVLEAGFNEHLVKPLKRADLERVLAQARQPH